MKNHVSPSPPPQKHVWLYLQTGAQVQPGKEALPTEPTRCVLSQAWHTLLSWEASWANRAWKWGGKKRLCHTSRVPVLERAEDRVGPGYTPSCFLTRHGTVTQRGQLALGPWMGRTAPQTLLFNSEGLPRAPVPPPSLELIRREGWSIPALVMLTHVFPLHVNIFR